MTNHRPSFVKSQDTLIVENALSQLKVGESISYDDLTTKLGRDCRQFCRGSLRTAVKALAERRMFFDVIRGEGLVRVAPEDAVHLFGTHNVTRVRRAAARGLKQLSAVDFSELSEEAKTEHMSSSTVLGVLHLFSKPPAVKKISSYVQASSERPAIGETLRMFTDARE